MTESHTTYAPTPRPASPGNDKYVSMRSILDDPLAILEPAKQENTWAARPSAQVLPGSDEKYIMLASIASDRYRIGAHTATPLCTSAGITDSTTAAWVPTEHRNAALNFRRMFPLPHDAPPYCTSFPNTQLFPALVASPFPPLLVQSSCELVPANPYPSRYPPLPVLKYTPSGRYPRPLSSVRHHMLDAGQLHAGCG